MHFHYYICCLQTSTPSHHQNNKMYMYIRTCTCNWYKLLSCIKTFTTHKIRQVYSLKKSAPPPPFPSFLFLYAIPYL